MTIPDGTFLAFEIFDEELPHLDESLSYIGADVNTLALSVFDKRKRTGDRHLNPNEDRHLNPGTEDRHLNPKGDRHLNPRPWSRHRDRGSNKFNKMCDDIKTDTGMDTICCICLELKSSNSCTNVDSLSRDKIDKYVVEIDLTRNVNGKYCICWTCRQSINKNKEPVRAQREFLGLLDFPENFKSEVRKICKPNHKKENVEDLNKLEDNLLKLVLPYITVRHMKGPYLKVVGDMILISSNLVHSLNKILPQPQELIPVALRKRMHYKGHYIQEYVDRDKLQLYFNFFKQYNHLYKDFEFTNAALDAFENETMNKLSNDESDSDSSSDEDDDIETSSNPVISMNGTASLITNKYKEDSSAPTVANKLADMIVQFESLSDVTDHDEAHLIFPEDEFYAEDVGDVDNEFDEDPEDLLIENLSNEDIEYFELVKTFKREIIRFNEDSFKQCCKCTLTKMCGILMQHYNDIQKL